MAARTFFHLLRRHLGQHLGRSLLAFAALLGASVLMLTLAGAGAALKFRVGDRLAQMFPPERLSLEPRRAALGPIALEPEAITPAKLEKIRGRGDVAQALAVEPIRLPVSVQGNLFGQEIASDAVIHGVPREMVADALKPGVMWERPKDTAVPYPIVASSYFLDLYNMGLARSSGLPLLSPSAVIGRHMYVVLGQSSVMLGAGTKKPDLIRAEIVGFSSDPSLIGLAMPADAVRTINKALAGKAEPEYVQMIVTLKAGVDPEEFLTEAEGMGLRLSGNAALGRNIKRGVAAAGWGLIALAAAVFALGLLTFYLLFSMIFHARRIDLVRLRALGVGPGGLLGLALGEAAAPAVTAVVVATGLVYAGMVQAQARLAPLLEKQSWVSADILEPSPGWLALTAGVVLLICMGAAAPMLSWVFRVEPGSVIRDL